MNVFFYHHETFSLLTNTINGVRDECVEIIFHHFSQAAGLEKRWARVH